MFVYDDDTSIEANLECVGCMFCSVWLINSVVSVTYEDRLFTYGCSYLSKNWDIFFCYTLTAWNYGPDSHWVFVYFDILCLIGSLQNWYHDVNRKPFLYRASSFRFIVSFNSCVVFSFNNLCIVGSLRSFMTMQSLLYWTTIVEPLSALLIISVGLLI